ncbi:MAG: 6-bladed beta-propeller [Gracilimonas sp.]|uniref:6-bladed beta-propeller n=1 Tax=Gracilimonas sp. TaxID=1974203 RepID=UPI003752DD9B|nr:6-bladed beta-propeller [Gracilimonas sp.]
MKICNPFKSLFGVSIIVFSLLGCATETSSENKIPISELSDFETLISFENEVLAIPVSMKYAGDSTLFIFDQGLGKVIELKESGEVIREYGRMGRGPGEFQRVNNIYITNDYFFVIDPGKFAVHKFDRSGKLHSTFDYGNSENQSTAVPPPPPMGLSVAAKNINNQPAITFDGNVLSSAIRFTDSTEVIFHRMNWEGEQLSSIGEIPAGSTFILDNEKIRDDVNNQVVPSYYRANVSLLTIPPTRETYF